MVGDSIDRLSGRSKSKDLASNLTFKLSRVYHVCIFHCRSHNSVSFFSHKLQQAGFVNLGDFIVPTPKQCGFSSLSVLACIFITWKSHVRFIRFEAGSAIEASTRAGVGWLMRRDLDLGMIHGLLHPLEGLLRWRVTVLVGVKLLRQTAIVLGELSLIHLLHALKNDFLRRAQEFVH